MDWQDEERIRAMIRKQVSPALLGITLALIIGWLMYITATLWDLGVLQW